MSSCAISAFASVYLLDHGLGNTEIGLLISLSGVAAAVLQPWLAGAVDQGRLLLKSLGSGLSLGISALALLLIAGGGHMTGHAIALAVLYGALIAVIQILLPLVSSLGMESINQGSSLDFGRARGGGSLAYAMLTFILGYEVALAGTWVVPAVVLVSASVLAVGIGMFPLKGKTSGMKAREKHKQAKTALFRRYPKYLFLLVGWTLVLTSHGLLNNFLFQIMESKGGNSSSMGTALAVAALCEIPTMFLFAKLVKIWKCGSLLKLSAIFFTIKSFGITVISDLTVIYLIHMLQMFGYGVYAVASVHYVNCIMRTHDQVRGQTYMAMTAALGSMIGSFVGGALIDGFGVGSMMWTATAVSVLGTLFIFRSVEKGV